MALESWAVASLKRREEVLKRLETTIWPWDNPSLSRSGRVCAFLEDLTITQGKLHGSKLRLRRFQKDFVDHVYRTVEDGRRPVRTAVLSVGRKNGKTQLAAGLALAHLCGPEAEPRGEVYSCANDRAQAGKIFTEMCALIKNHEYLRARCNILAHSKTIIDLEMDSIYVALSREAKTKLGLSPSMVVYDELGSSEGRELFDAMNTAMGSRVEPLMLVISTQAAEDIAPMSQLIDYGLRVKAREIDRKSTRLNSSHTVI